MRRHTNERMLWIAGEAAEAYGRGAGRGGGRGRGRGDHEHDGSPWMRGGGGRMRRGDIRTALLLILEEGPGHGYELIQRLEEKSDGAWRPSPGSVYPTLQLLDDEGLVTARERDGKRTFEITDAGKAEAASRVEDAGGTPWELAGRGGRPSGELRGEIGNLMLAARQIAGAASKEQTERAVAILKDARKQLYAILAED
jgi:DNA-binding PadR family transcriptional regulator